MSTINILQHRYLDVADDLEEIGSLLYYTDPYIYPAFFGDEKTARIVVAEAIRRGMFCFRPENIFCSFAGTEPVAMVCKLSSENTRWNHQAWKNLFVNLGLKVPCDFDDVSLRYFTQISKETFADAIYVLAVCVHPRLRGQGIGTESFRNFLLMHSKETIILDTLKGNQAALSLYQAAGFVEQESYLGYSLFSPHPECVRMVRKS